MGTRVAWGLERRRISALPNIPGFSRNPGLGIEIWISAVRDWSSKAGLMTSIFPLKVRSGKAVTDIFTGWPFCRERNSFSMTLTTIFISPRSMRVRMGVVSFTIVPGSTYRFVTPPFMGERIIRFCSWAWTKSSDALAWRTWASARARSVSQVFCRRLFRARL